MVELSIILDELQGSNDQVIELARVIKSHGVGNYILKRRLIDIVSSEDDPEMFMDILIDKKIISESEELEGCSDCESPLLDSEYCIFCEHSKKTENFSFYKVLDLIKFVDEWRSIISERIDDTVKASDREYLKLIASQVKTLDVLPIVPIEIRTKEVQYQLVGARILYPAFEVELESIGKDGRSDLKFKKSGEVTNYVGEYKLWSNKSNNPVDQCLNYFLSETESGFVFMANDSHSNIWSDYVTKYVKGSATFINDNSDSFLLTEDKNYVNIYCSYHLCPISAKRVAIYHFIYNLHGNFGTRPQAIKKPKAKKVSSK
ncbi:MAG: hypothetical protein JNM93_00380 [Bacteriovoracaceae bacterium]|nr:hypothetical protein [Bacteriovoracaceae bacterium]